MKVMCIDADWVYEGPQRRVGPKFGEICTVDATDTDENGVLYYGLVEYPRRWYQAVAFVPLSEINETDMVRDYNTQTA